MNNQHTFEAFLEAVKTGNLTVVDSFLTNTQGVNQVASNENQALRWAAENGHLPVVNRLLEFDAVVARVTAVDNYALRWAAFMGHLPVVNRLLEIASVRQADLGLPLAHCLISKGLKRALWLSLQETPDFSEISTAGELSIFASHYLQQHPDWVHASVTQGMKDTLIRSLSNQVLAFAYNSPLYTLHKCAPSSVIAKSTSPELPLALIKRIEAYVGPHSKGLSYFNEPRFEPVLTLSFKLYQGRYSPTHEKANAPSNTIAMSLLSI